MASEDNQDLHSFLLYYEKCTLTNGFYGIGTDEGDWELLCGHPLCEIVQFLSTLLVAFFEIIRGVDVNKRTVTTIFIACYRETDLATI